jgi:hypothetical protein
MPVLISSLAYMQRFRVVPSGLAMESLKREPSEDLARDIKSFH